MFSTKHTVFVFATLAAVAFSVADEKKPEDTLGLDKFYLSSPSYGTPYIHLDFHGDIDPADLEGRIEFVPPVKVTSIRPYYSWSSSRSDDIRVDGEFKPGQTYEMIIRKGLPSGDEDLAPLPYDLVRVLEFPDRACDVSLELSGNYLAPEDDVNLPVSTMNMDELEVKAEPVLPQNIVLYAQIEHGSLYTGGSRPYAGTENTVTFKVKNELNKQVHTDIPLSQVIGKGERGIFCVHGLGEERLICVSDIGLMATVDETSTRVWATSLSTGKPLPKTKLWVYTGNNVVLGEGETGPDGIASFTYEKGNDKPFLVLAISGDETDMTYLPFVSKLDTTEPFTGKTFGNVPAEYLEEGACDAYVFLERGIYRPGEKVFVQAILRDKERRAPKPFPVLVEMCRAAGESLLQSKQVMPDETGAIILPDAFQIPDNAMSGRWYVRVKMPGTDEERILGETELRVESFVPKQIKVVVEGLPAETAYCATNEFTVRADYLFGKPGADLEVSAQVAFSDTPFKPDGWKGWSFDNPERHLKKFTNSYGKGTLDEDGKDEYLLSFPLEELEKNKPSSAVKAVFEATVLEPGGRPVSARAETLMHVYPYYIGVKSEKYNPRPGTTNTLSVVLVTPNGVLRRGAQSAQAVLSSVNHFYGYVRNPNGSYSWVSERRVKKISESPVSLEQITKVPFSAPHSGSFLLAIRTPDGVENTYAFDAYGADEYAPSSNLENPSKVELSFDKPVYRAGETARLKIKAPFTGTAELTLLHKTVLSQRVIPLKETTSDVELKVERDWYPNIYAAIRVVNISTNTLGWSARRAAGSAVLRVERPEHEFHVAVAANVQIVPGGSRITADVAVPGAPAGSHVTLMVVDESIHQLTDEPCPDPVGFLARERKSLAWMYDFYSQIMLVTPSPAARAAIGGDDEEELMKRVSPVRSRRFKPLALWKPGVPLVNGAAHVDLDLPEFSGEVRVTAVAWSSTAAGAAKVHTKVAPKLVVQPDAPRFLAGGDKADMTLTLHNNSGKDDTVAYEVSFNGVLGDSALQKNVIPLVKGASKTLRFPIGARQTGYGEGEITVKTEGCGETHTQTLYIPVRPAVPLTTTYEYVTLKAGESKTFLLPPGVVTNAVRQNVIARKSAYTQFLPALQYLLNYPYGCLEQTTSSVFPLIAADGAFGRLGCTNAAQLVEARSKIKEAIQRISSMGACDFYTIWPRSSEHDDGLSCYAGYFIASAFRAGIDMPEGILTEARGILRNIATDARVSVDNRAYACQGLATLGDFRHQLMLHLLDRQAEFNVEGRFHLSAAFALAGRRDLAYALISKIEYADTIRAAAFGILAWSELETPDRDAHIQKLFHQIVASKKKSGHWGNTQENALALLAAATLARREKQDERGFALEVTDADGKKICSTSKDGFSFSADNAAFIARNDGPGPVTLVRTVKAYPLLASMKEHENGLRITRTFYRPDGTPFTGPVKLGDQVIVKLQLQSLPADEFRSDVVIDELLPSCLEVETTGLKVYEQFPKLEQFSDDWLRNKEVLDDRVLFFSKAFDSRKAVVYYVARAVSAGTFIIPPCSAECMYDTEYSCRGLPGTLVIKEK